jgi:flagellar protein FlaF
MYQFQYAEILDETPQSARDRERQAFSHAIELLRRADEAGPRSREAIDAIVFLRRLWVYLIEDLNKPENDLTPTLRADLISIGLWVLREAEEIRLEKSGNFNGLIEVCSAIRDGLQ